MLWNDDTDYDISKIVKGMIPVGAKTVYQPGQEGFLEQDLTQPAGTTPTPKATDLATPSNPPITPMTRGALPIENEGGYQNFKVGGTEYRLPASAITSAISDSTGGTQGPPKYQIPTDMMSYFDDVVKTLTGKSQDAEQLRSMSQGFGLIGLGPKESAQMRLGATKALENLEGIKRNAAANLAHTLSYLMTEPSKFNLGMYGKQLEYDLGRRGAGVAERKTAIEEMKAPGEIKKLGMTAPDTIAGIGPSGEKLTMSWNPEEGKWETISKGALPIGVHEGETLINPSTGETIGKGGEKTRFKENLGQIAFKTYADELKKIEDDLRYMISDGTPEDKKESITKAKIEAQGQAWGRLQDTMKRLGYGDMFENKPSGPVPQRNPEETIEEYLKRTGGM